MQLIARLGGRPEIHGTAKTRTLGAFATLAIMALLVACDALGEIAPGQRPSASFVAWLAAWGRQFTPATAPAGSAAPEEVLRAFRADFPQFAADQAADPPIYGIVSCADSRCDMAGWPGERVAIWLIGFPDTPVSSGGTAWAAVDSETGNLIIGDGPMGH
jgi:hypothetical protein